jgi:pimeloyl-ACP methyl ester carboxylesterase
MGHRVHPRDAGDSRGLPKLAVPVVMLHGGKDYQVPISNVEYVRAQLAAAGKGNLFEPLVFPEYNHFIPWEHPEAVEGAIRTVSDRLSKRPGH